GILPGEGACSVCRKTYAGVRLVRGRYLLLQRAEAILLEEKADKLFGLTRLLDAHLEGDYDDILRLRGIPPDAPPEQKLKVLNEALSPFTDLVAGAFPGVGVGYYSADLDCILTYGPSGEFGNKVGITVDPCHLGRQAMAQRRDVVGVGSMVRGDIMNCMRPLLRGNRTIGFCWANETLEDIYRQMEFRARKVFFSPDVEPVLGLTGLLLSSSRSLLTSLRQFPAGPPRSLTYQPPGESADALPQPPSGDALGALAWSLDRIRRYLTLFLNSLSLGVLIADHQEEVAFVNQALTDLAGITSPPAGLPLPQALTSIGLSELVPAVGELRRTGERYRFASLVLAPPARASRPVRAILSRIEDLPGQGAGLVVLVEDEAGAREEEERLRRAERLAALGELASTIAHEIRNPVTIVAGCLELLGPRAGDREFVAETARIATEELGRINRTVNALLDFARFAEPHLTNTDVNQVLRRATALVRDYARSQHVQVTEEYGDLPSLSADPDHLQQAFLNLLINAVQAMPGGGTLGVRTSCRQGSQFVRVEITDTGEGIKREDQDRVFNMFFTTRTGGTGLGLALVHRIVDEHGGMVEFESEPGRGTSFVVHLPVRVFSWPERHR
ncbi:MAG: ATP-binding protein, partial [Bacillota bacterium]